MLLQRVLVNLLGERAPLLPRRRTAVIVVDESVGDRCRCGSSTTGRASPTKQRESAFVPFQRLGDTDNTTGIGLGLALSRGFVEGMGGTLEAEDTPGGGLTMVVSLPCSRRRIRRPGPASDAALERRVRRGGT